MPYKSGSVGAGAAGDWFSDRFVRARTLVPAAEFDTVLGMDFDETITVELADVVGVASGAPISGVNGGAFEMDVGDPIIAPCQARWQPTGCGGHVKMLHVAWYLAALARFGGPFTVPLLADTEADALALWVNDNNRVTLGVLGDASGGSTTNFVGRIRTGGGDTDTILGPGIGGGPTGVYHLWEMWNDETAVHCAIDGVEFAATMPTANLPFSTARISPLIRRDAAIAQSAGVVWEKHVLVTTSPRPGSPD